MKLVERGIAAATVATHVFYKNGKFKDQITAANGAVILSRSRGTWRIKGGRFMLSGKEGGKHFSGTIKVTKNGFLSVSRGANGKLVLKARRK